MGYPGILFHILILYGAAGLCMGSFATAIIHREKNNEPWFHLRGDKARSACPSCGARLGLRDLVPLFSWLALKGRCRNCGGKIPAFYPVTEGAACLGAVAIVLACGPTLSSIIWMACLPFLISALYLIIVCRLWPLRVLAILFLLAVPGLAASSAFIGK